MTFNTSTTTISCNVDHGGMPCPDLPARPRIAATMAALPARMSSVIGAGPR